MSKEDTIKLTIKSLLEVNISLIFIYIINIIKIKNNSCNSDKGSNNNNHLKI